MRGPGDGLPGRSTRLHRWQARERVAHKPLLYVGNDGGLWRSLDGVNQQQTPCSTDDATHFQNLNSGLGSLAEVVSFAENPTDPATLLAGLGAKRNGRH